ncbi:MAG: NYN domain-containing protein [Candidatus Omnitrophica bacterium]|nr:NYN domain-containing protein [Candidatus Omnitrophota bacterium]
MPIIIDGWNFIRDARSDIDDDRDDPLSGARELVMCLERYQRDHKDPITVVFDSRYEHLDTGFKNSEALKIVPARNADEYIGRYIDSVPERQRRNLRVVSSDKKIYYYAKDARATPLTSSEFWEKIS